MDRENRAWLLTTSAPMVRGAAPENVPETLGIDRWMNIEDQGMVGSCAGHARTSVLEACIYHQTRGTVVQLSRMFAYLTAQKIDGISGDNGSTITGNAQAAEQWGTCREEFFPYPGRYTTKIPKAAWDNAGEFKLRTWRVLRSYDETWRWLAMGLGGVQIGIGWNASCDRPVMESYKPGGGGHSVAFLDWTSRRDSQGRRYLKLFNSWGKGWGNAGTSEVAPKAVDQMLDDGFTVFVGMSDMADLKPRSVDWLKESVFA